MLIYKPNYVVPSKKFLTNSYSHNKDGIGVGYSVNGVVSIKKDFKDYKEFEKFMKTLPVESHAVIHFRFATHGLKDNGNCHPFPLSNSDIELRKTHIPSTNYAIAHNGIITEMPKDPVLSDTQQFIKIVLSDKVVFENLDKEPIKLLIGNLLGGDKLIILSAQEVKMYGNFIKASDGCYYSNDGFKENDKASWYDCGWSRSESRSYKQKVYQPYWQTCSMCGCDDMTRWVKEYDCYLCEICTDEMDLSYDTTKQISGF
jgi:predicted glutamine amidotransferase